jgi:predicted Ser/Thr protein kinase
MMNPTGPSLCPECGKPVPSGSLHQVCPACLMAQAIASRTVLPDGETNASIPPLSPEEIADKFPQFEITECLGRGGMGVVYKARQKSLGRWVAIKILPPERVGEEKFSERFAREAATLARLSHPNIVTIHDFGEADGLFYIVMEFIDGVNLRDLLRDGKLEPEQALAIVPPVCEALQYAHGKSIVHRDIKPENLLLDRDGRIKIADFGIAALIGAGGENIGTPPYMAPEQSGAQSGIDHRADIYALGVVLYEMLTGERPAKELVAPSKKVQIDVRLDEMVLRALERTPELRYQTAGEFRTAVETIVETPPPLANHAADAPIRAGETLYATAEFLATTWGAMKLHEGMGTLSLYVDRLVIGRGGQSTEIPFHAVRRLRVMSYPFWLSPMGRISILVEFEEAGKLHRIALMPTKGMFPFPGDSKPRVTEWFIAIREAITAANSQPPAGSETPELYCDFSSDGLMWAKLSMICSPVVGLVALYLIFSGSSKNPGPVLLYLLFFIGGFFFVVRHRRNEWRRNNPLPKTAGELAGKTPPADARELSEVRSEIAAPAIAMAIVGGINLLGAILGLLAFGLIALGLIPLLPARIGAGSPHMSVVPWLGTLGFGGMTAIVVAIALGWMLLWIGAWVFTLVSALRMRRLQSRGWAIAGANILIAAGLIGFAFANGPTPWITGVWSVIELGTGIWALVELLSQDVRETFENALRVPDTTQGSEVTALSRNDARSQVTAPATGLMVTSVLNLLLTAAALLLMMFFAHWKLTPSSETLSFSPPGMSLSRTTSPPPQRPVWLLLLPVAAVIFIVIPSLLTFIGAWRMRGLRGYGLATTGAILGIITPPGLLIGLIFGIWALVVLSRREVRDAFDSGTTRPVGKALLITGGVVAGIVLLVFLARFGLPVMHQVPKESFGVVSSESERAIPGQIKHMGLSGLAGSELFLDLETGTVFKHHGGSDRPRVDILRATGIDLSVRFDPDKPRVTYWGCSLHGIGGGGPGLLIDGPAMQPDFVEPGWGKSLRQIYNELPVPSADSSSSVEGAFPLGVLVRTRNGPVALELTRYVAAPGGSPQLDLRYVLLPPPGGAQPQVQTVFDLHPVIELTIPTDKDGLTDMFDPENGQMILATDPGGAPQGQAGSSRKGLLIKHDSQANQTELVGMNGVMTQESRADQWDEITNLQALDTLRKN